MPGEMLALPAPPPGGLGSDGAIVVSTAREEVEEPKKAPPASVPTQTRAVGMIHPPPDIRSIVDKTSQFVARNGPEFEKRILANERHNVKFNFLNPTDPYHAYYQHQVTTFRAQLQGAAAPAGTAPAAAPGTPSGAPGTSDVPAPGTQEATTAADAKAAAPQAADLTPPEPEQYTVRLPEAIQGLDLDIIKLTAQFVARNGKSFLTGLTSREHMNPQFHFLKPTHSMFTFFTALADAYSKVLMPPKGLPDKLKRDAADRSKLLERCLQRLEWEKSQARARQQAEDAIEQERVQMALIDWHDFVVVETIEFNDEEDEELPKPMTMDEVIRRSKALAEEEALEQEIADAQKEMAMEMDVEELEMVQQGLRDTSLSGKPQGDEEAPPPPPEDEDMEEEMEDELPPLPEEPEVPIRVVKNWKRPEERATAEHNLAKMVVSPITGELINVDDMAEHIRISLIDPKYKEQKERMMAKLRETTLAPDDEIGRNIVSLARTRPDIFGTTEEEVSNAVKAEMEKKKEEVKHVVWDGHAGSIGRTATAAMAQTTTNLQQSAEEQIAQLQREKANLGPDNRPLPGATPPPLNPPKLAPPPLRPLPPPPGLTPNIPRPALAPLPQPTIPISKPQSQTPLSTPPTTTPSFAPPPIRPPVLAPPPRPLPSGGPPVPPPPSGAPPLLARPPGAPQQPPPPGSLAPPSLAPPPIPRPMPLPTPPRPMYPPAMPYGPPGVPPPRPVAAPPPMPPPQAMPPPPPPEDIPPPPPEEPEPKRQKIGEDVHLFPEEVWLAQHPGAVRISVSVPSVDGEASLNGQMIEVTTTLAETIASLKEKIAAEIGLPANKQKLSGRPGFFKDNVSLAYYNLADTDTVTLALKERGGKKK